MVTLEVFLHPWKDSGEPNLLADWTVLLASDDGKVAADRPQAGEDLEEREGDELEVKDLFQLSFHCNAGEKHQGADVLENVVVIFPSTFKVG